MKLKVVRDTKGLDATIGQLTVDGVAECYTLEDKVRQVAGKPVEDWKVPGQTAIPRGNYIVIVDWSPRFKRLMPRLLDVPGYDGVLIHPGNWAKDTEGCILVGQGVSGLALTNSLKAFNQLFPKIQAAYHNHEPLSIEVL